MRKKAIWITLAAAVALGTAPAYASIADENVVWSADYNTETGEMTVLTDNTVPSPTYTEALPNGAVRMVVDNKELAARGVVIDGRTLVPLRALGEALGATVNWDASKQEIRIEKMLYQADSKGIATESNRIILMYIGNHTILKNGNEEVFDVAPQMIDGSTMVPVKAVTSFLEAATTWDGASKTVKVTSSRNTTPEGALKEKQYQQIGMENATANRLNELNQQYALEEAEKTKAYIAENKPKGDLNAWGYDADFRFENHPTYGDSVMFSIYPGGGYDATKTQNDVESEWFWMEIVDKNSGTVVYKTAFQYGKVQEYSNGRIVGLPEKEYTNNDQFLCKFSVVMNREEAMEYQKLENAQLESKKQEGNLEDWGYTAEIKRIYNIQGGIEPLNWIEFDISYNPLKAVGDIRDQKFRLCVVDKNTDNVVFETQFVYGTLTSTSDYKKLTLPSAYLDENKYDYHFYVVV